MKLKEEDVHGASLEWSKQRLSAFSNKALSIKREHVKKSECDHCFFFPFNRNFVFIFFA